jgi:hypothetical protein
MFGLFKKTKPDIVEALINQTIGGQSVMYRLFREALGCEDSKIRRLELTYFASAVMTAVYLRLGKEPNREQILDRVIPTFGRYDSLLLARGACDSFPPERLIREDGDERSDCPSG